MSFDGIVTRAITKELSDSLETGRITKIYQPYKNELIMQIRAKGENHKLLISAHPSYSRVHLTNAAYQNPSEPPMFCMLLRKHLEGGFIESIVQKENERLIKIQVKTRTEIGDDTTRVLIIEIMGRHSNVILVNETHKIIDSIKHITPAVSRLRTVLPGNEYVEPPAQEKVDPMIIEKEDDILRRLDFNSGKLATQIVNAFSGVSPLFANEVIFRAGLVNRTTIPKPFLELVHKVKNHEYKSQMILANNKEYFYVLPLTHLKGETKEFESISELLDRYYFGKAERDRVRQQGNDLERLIKNEKDKNVKKIKKLEKTLKDAEKAEQFQLYGELLTANMHTVKQGQKEIEVINYYDEEGGMITIPLEPNKSPSKNAQRYFSKYQKAKNSVAVVNEQIEKAYNEIEYFSTLLQQMESASPKDLEEIREELMEEGYIRKRIKKSGKNKKAQVPTLEQYKSTDGTKIYVGKNNKQNEYLTNRLAKRDDIWLHTKDIPGSHVVIQSTEPSEETLLEAANIAAYFSKARTSSTVPVDYTKIRNVKKPSGAKPGFVTYDNQKTLFVTPDEDLIVKLKDTK